MEALYQLHKQRYKGGTYRRRMRHIMCYIRHRNIKLYFVCVLFDLHNLPIDLFDDFVWLLGIERLFTPIQCFLEPCWNCNSNFFLMCAGCCEGITYDIKIDCRQCKSKYFCKLCCNCTYKQITT